MTGNEIAIATLCVCGLGTLIFCYKKHEIFDRFLAFNYFNAIMVALISLYAALKQESALIDIAFLYIFISYISSMAILRYVQHKKHKRA